MTAREEVLESVKIARIENHGVEQIQDMTVIDSIFDKGRTKGISTGYGSLDDIIGGLKSGSCTIVGGATGMGKSLLGINILVNIAKHGTPVCYIDLENGMAESYERIMGIWFEKDQDWFEDEKNKEQALEMKAEIDLNFRYYSHEHLANLGFNEEGIKLLNRIIKTEVKQGIKIFLIDPLQAVEQSENPSQNFVIQGMFIEAMKNLTQEFGITIIILHHLRKTTYSGGQQLKADEVDKLEEPLYRMPTIEDFKGSSKITDFATAVWGILRPINSKDSKIREKLVIRILKNRTGNRGDAKLKLIEKNLKITERDNFSPRFNLFKGFADSE